MSAIDKQTIEKIKQDLLNRKAQLEKEINEVADEQNVKFPDYGDKPDENAQEVDEYTANLATDKVLESTLRDINNTLKRIEDGTYGICKFCNQPINEKRLLARPVASTCVECKTKLQNS